MRARSIRTLTIGAGAVLAVFCAASDARAQAGVAQKPLPNVMLLVDTSGSMERMVDNTLPGFDLAGVVPVPATACVPGVSSPPNRWGILNQALNGNLQPYSCARQDRATGGAFSNEYAIGQPPTLPNTKPYDADYFLPHHRMLSGTAGAACAIGPWRLPGGAGVGVGPTNQASTDLPAGTFADGFPNDALRSLKWTDIAANYPGNVAIPNGPLNTCDYLQADDGQLDASRDYIRFSMMTFDQDLDPGLGVSAVDNGTVLAANPFKGQWSYLRNVAFPYGGLSGMAAPTGCATPTPFEVGARNWAAPPWEGRLVRFPDPFGSLADIQRTNDQIQQVLMASRPYGATPIDAMLDDARDYIQNNPKGPEQSDPYVSGGCRDQFNILLTDGAPNLAMRPSCEVAGAPAGQCPYPGAPSAGVRTSIAWDIARAMASSPHPVKTFVIGFSVNGATAAGDGFPVGLPGPSKTCSAWYTSGPPGFSGNSTNMSAFCRNPVTAPAIGTTADACCQLNEIAYYGGGQLPTAHPYFADSQAQLVNAFGQVLAQITQTASTRTVPAYTATQSQAAGTRSLTGSFTAAFVPNSRKPWSGQLNRQREQCVGGLPVPIVPAAAQGDVFDQNLSQQAVNGDRMFITMVGDNAGLAGADSFRTMRPFYTAVTDLVGGIAPYQGTEYGKQAMGLIGPGLMKPVDMGIDVNTCKKTSVVQGGTDYQISALTPLQCQEVVWRFATATSGLDTIAGTSAPAGYNFNLRCPNGGATCAATGIGCVNDVACDAANKGDVCVPACAALGAIFRSSPASAGAPGSLSRDEGYRVFADARATRPPALFVATTDGVLHGFKSLDEGGTAAKHELWAFVPPAVLPKLAVNYPGGQQLLLDGSPIVKDVVWDRDRTQIQEARQWHTTLVAGMGSNGPGYYAMNVTDVDCGNNSCDNLTYKQPTHGLLDYVSVAAQAGAATPRDYPNSKAGPHFLWQITDVERIPADVVGTPTIRKSLPVASGGDGKSFVPLFGRATGTPAITTLLFKPTPASAPREIGVAILPGGLDGPADKLGSCPRFAAGPGLSDVRPVFNPRPSVHQWGTTCAAPVAGRSVTIVRLDTGEIVRHFSRVIDAPAAVSGGSHFTAAPFDSPVTGTPIPFPSDVGAVATRAFIGDADGTMWRLDLSGPDPATWNVSLFQDLFAGGAALDGQPISVAPIASLDPTGNLVLNVSTGEQENLVATSAYNMVYSIVEGKPVGGTVRAQVQWYTKLTLGERVTGPMAVFDGTLYFATYLPEQNSGGGVCSVLAKPFLFAVDYFRPVDILNPNLGGQPKYPPTLPATRLIPGGADLSATAGPTLIPGVAVKQSLACANDLGAPTTDYFGMANYGVTQQSASAFSLVLPLAKGAAGGLATIPPIPLPKPRTPTAIDSWALVVD